MFSASWQVVETGGVGAKARYWGCCSIECAVETLPASGGDGASQEIIGLKFTLATNDRPLGFFVFISRTV